MSDLKVDWTKVPFPVIDKAAWNAAMASLNAMPANWQASAFFTPPPSPKIGFTYNTRIPIRFAPNPLNPIGYDVAGLLDAQLNYLGVQVTRGWWSAGHVRYFNHEFRNRYDGTMSDLCIVQTDLTGRFDHAVDFIVQSICEKSRNRHIVSQAIRRPAGAVMSESTSSMPVFVHEPEPGRAVVTTAFRVVERSFLDASFDFSSQASIIMTDEYV